MNIAPLRVLILLVVPVAPQFYLPLTEVLLGGLSADADAVVAVALVAVAVAVVVLAAVLVTGATLPMAMATFLTGRVGVTSLLGTSSMAIFAIAGISFTLEDDDDVEVTFEVVDEVTLEEAEEEIGVAMGRFLSPPLVLLSPLDTTTVWATETLMRG